MSETCLTLALVSKSMHVQTCLTLALIIWTMHVPDMSYTGSHTTQCHGTNIQVYSKCSTGIPYYINFSTCILIIYNYNNSCDIDSIIHYNNIVALLTYNLPQITKCRRLDDLLNLLGLPLVQVRFLYFLI